MRSPFSPTAALALTAVAAACRPPVPEDTAPADTSPTDSDPGPDTVIDSDPETDPPAEDTSWYDDASTVPTCEIGGQVRVEVGPPEVWDFATVAAGAIFEVEKGNQGLWHTYASVRCRNVVPGDDDDPRDRTNPIVSFRVESTEGEFLAGYDLLPRPMNLYGNGSARLHHEILVWRLGTFEDAIHRDAVLRLSLRDSAGQEASASLPVRLEPWPGYVPPESPADTGATP